MSGAQTVRMGRMLRGQFKRWRLAEPLAGGEPIADALRVHPLVGQLLVRRGLTEPAAAERFLRPKLGDLHDPQLLPGCDKAAQRIVDALRQGEKVVIYGDYDVDGVTATSILYHTLKAAQPDADVLRYIPHRIDEGYGLNAESLEKLIAQGAKLIVSVDCGITAHEPARVVAESDADLIITDHHEMDDRLPEAYALVHPRLHERDGAVEAAYPYGELCGAGVAYKLAWQVARTWCGSERVTDVFRELLVNLLPLAALGTVADVVPLVDENRTIVQYGLGRIKHTPFEGLNAMIDASRLREEKVDAYHVGFVLGPRLNACGRMGHAISACKLLTTATGGEAHDIAEFLNSENDKRRATEHQIFQQAVERVKQSGYDGDDVRAIVLADDHWHPGVIGIVCSRLVERFGRPAVLLNTANGEASGSARSIDGFNIHEAFGACAEHLASFGGHAMAAGLKLPTDAVAGFRDALVAYANERIAVEDLVPAVTIDAELPLAEATQGLCEQLETLAPFGRANPTPRWLVSGAQVAGEPRIVGRDGKHLKVTLGQGGRSLPVIAWGQGPYAEHFAAGRPIDAVIELKLNRWNNRASAEGVMVDFRFEPQG